MKRIGVLFLAMCLVGCSPYSTGGNQTENPTESSEGISLMEERPEHITKQISDHLFVDADVTYPEEESYATYRATNLYTNKATETVLKEIFQWGDEVTVQVMDGGLSYIHRSEDGRYTYESGMIAYQGNLYQCSDYQQNVYYYDMIQSENEHLYRFREDFDTIDTQKEFDNFTRKEAVEKAQDIAEQLRIPIAEEPRVCVALTVEDLNVLTSEPDSAMEGYQSYFEEVGYDPYVWSEKDEGYYMLWEYEFAGYPMAYDNLEDNVKYSLYENKEQGGCLILVFDKNGEVKRLQTTYGTLENGGELKTPEAFTVTMDDVLKKIESHFAQEILQSKMTVIDIRFCYMPKVITLSQDGTEGEWEMYPGYEVFVETEDKTKDNSVVIRINGITGEMLVY